MRIRPLLRVSAFLFAFAFVCRGYDSTPPDPILASVIGKAALVLSKNGKVSLIYQRGLPVLFENGKPGQVSHPDGKLTAAQHLETEIVPEQNGIVLQFIGPQTRFPQSPWREFLDTEKHTFFFIFMLPGDQGVGVRGSYGENFPPAYLKELRDAVEK